MKLTLENTAKIGKRCLIFDAEGKEVHGCIECDTETGEIERNACNDKGEFIVEGNDVKRVKETRSAPLRVEWL